MNSNNEIVRELNREINIDLNKIVYRIIKRLFDIFVSIVGVIFILPIAFIVKVSYLFVGDIKPIFYKHKRIGKDGKIIYIYKFRTMVSNAEEVLKQLLKEEKYRKEWEENQKFKYDPRITKLGNILRKTSIDEIPQFINVLKGDMSLIGPRPLVEGELESHDGNEKLYNSIKPGITGWWAANGRSQISYDERLKLEYYYIRNCSILLDIKCILKTIQVVLNTKGAV